MAAVPLFFHSSDSNLHPPHLKNPPHPRLAFAKFSRNNLRPYTLSSTPSNRRIPEVLLPRPRSRFASNSSRSWSHLSELSCFRCGKVGHFAKACRAPARCFVCGACGHKKANCGYGNQTKEASASPFIADLSLGKDDDGWILRKEMDLKAKTWADPLLSDPDVIGCAPIFKVSDLVFSQSTVVEDMSDGFSSEQTVPVLGSGTSMIHSQVSLIGCPSFFGAVQGMGKRLGAPVIVRVGHRYSCNRQVNKGTRFDRAAMHWTLQRMLGFGSHKFNYALDAADLKAVTSESSSTVCYDFPTIEEDLSSEEQVSIPNSLSYKQVELNIEPISPEDILDIEVIDEVEDSCKDCHSEVASHLKLNQPNRLETSIITTASDLKDSEEDLVPAEHPPAPFNVISAFVILDEPEDYFSGDEEDYFSGDDEGHFKTPLSNSKSYNPVVLIHRNGKETWVQYHGSIILPPFKPKLLKKNVSPSMKIQVSASPVFVRRSPRFYGK